MGAWAIASQPRTSEHETVPGAARAKLWPQRRQEVQKSGAWAWTSLVIVCGLALVNCGARTTLSDDPDTSAADAAPAPASGNGGAPASVPGPGGTAGDDCIPAPSCGGSSNLEPYARLRVACGGDTTVNRRGDPVRICHHIK